MSDISKANAIRHAAALGMSLAVALLATGFMRASNAQTTAPTVETPSTPAAPATTPTTPAPPSAPNDALPDIEARLAVARTATKKHATRLKTELTQALKDGGPKGAIGSCVSLAPDTDATVSEEYSVEIGRTSNKVRNTENAADNWELAGLEKFAQQITEGGDPQKLEFYEVTVTTEGQRLFRYMRPIMMQEMCLACHGPNLPQDMKSEIAKSYPDDKAIGFNVGELRGAFTLVQRVD